jgi:3-methyl-2-oxobutanoate hydroxymethyltransferase
MSSSTAARLTAPDIMARKGAEKIVCLIAYTAPMAALLDRHVPFKSQDRT